MAEEDKQKTAGGVEEELDSVHQGMLDARGNRKSPWSWVGTLYFAEGIPYILAMVVSVIMYKKMGISNTKIAYYTSLLYLPWVVKPLWSPIVDIIKTKRIWIVVMQFLLALGLAGVAICLNLPNFFVLTIVFLFIIAFCSATHDIACDGFYMLGLTKHQQAWFVGVRSTFYRLAMLTGQGLLVILAGLIESQTGLETVDLVVKSDMISAPQYEHYKYIKLTEDQAELTKDKPILDILTYYKEWSKETDDIHKQATFAYLADAKIEDYRKKLKEGEEDLSEQAMALFDEIVQPLDENLLQQLTEKATGVEEIDGDLRIIIQPEELTIPYNLTIPTNDSKLTVFAAERWNTLQGQPRDQFIAREKEKEKGPIKKAWENFVAKPVKKMFVLVFGEHEAEEVDRAGNLDYVYVRLSRAPPEGERAVNFGRTKGSKDISLKGDIRFVFNEANWNKPVRAVIELDPKLEEETQSTFSATSGNVVFSWTITFAAMAGLFLFFCFYHFFTLPHPVEDTSRFEEASKAGKPFTPMDFVHEFFDTFISFFQKKGIVSMIIFLCFYRFAEAQLVKLYGPFLLDAQEKGGLALTTAQIGIAYGTVGLICLTLGGLLGGWAAARDGLKKWIWFMAIAINVPDAVYIFLAFVKPDSFAVVCACVGFETFGYGFGFTAYMLYMIFIAEGKHKTAHFAIATGFMALGMMIPGMFSGWIQSIIGYQDFFIWIMISTIPGFVSLLFIPLDPEFGKKKSKKKKVDAEVKTKADAEA